MSIKSDQNRGREGGGFVRRSALPIALAAGLAAAAVGCAHSGSQASFGNGSAITHRMADRSNVTIDANATVGRYDAPWYIERAGEAQLPPLWLGEAVQATAQTQAARAEGVAARVARHADENAELAHAEATLRSAMGDEQVALANADGLRATIDAKTAELTTKANADESSLESKARLNDALVKTMSTQRKAEFDAMRSQAVKEFEQAKADYTGMLGQRKAVMEDGRVEIAKMTRVADLTESRAASKVLSLRAQAAAVRAQTKARLADLNQQIASLTEQIGADSARLRTQAASLGEEGSATSSELRAKADALAERDVQQQYTVRVKSAEATLAQAQSAFDEAQQQADASMQEIKAGIERKRADAEKFKLVSEADYHQQVAATTRFKQHNMAEVFVQRAKAQEIENTARDEFVKAQAEAIAQAGREEAAHLDQLAKKQFDKIKAQAEADAAAIRAQMIEQLAAQMAEGSVELPGKGDGASGAGSGGKKASRKNADAKNAHGAAAEPVTAQTPAPESPEVSSVPAVIEPEHVAAFKSALAHSTRLRAQADAKERAVLATFQERTKKLDAWWSQQKTRHEQMIAETAAYAQQASVKTNESRAKAEQALCTAQAEHDSSLAQAEAFRMDTQAQITNLRAEAQRVAEQKSAERARLLAQAEASDAGGAAEIRALGAQRDAAKRRGAAQAQSFLAEAAATETGQRALVAQMRQEIASAKQILSAELARLDQSAESFIQIEQASHDEAVAIADAFAEKTRIASDRMTIDNEVTRKIAQAEVDHRRNIVNAQELAGQAQVERLVARATAHREIAESADVSQRAGVYAQSQIVDAAVTTRFTQADAKDENVRALFESRIASVQADRDRAFASRYLSQSQQKARLAQAQAAAAAYRDLSSAATAMLSEKQQAFERAAKSNWDARLAMPAGSVELDWPTLDPNFKPPFPNEPVTPPAFADADNNSDFDN